MWIGDVTTGIMFQRPWSPVGNITVSTPLMVIDSHSRNERGEISDTGASILMTFSTVNNFVQYIINTYIQQISLKAFQLQFVHCKRTLTSGQCRYVCSKHVSLEQNKVRKAQDKERIHVAYTQRKDAILKKRKLKYSVIDGERKRALLNKAKEKYRTIDNMAKISLLDKIKLRYKRMDNEQQCKRKLASNRLRKSRPKTQLEINERKLHQGEHMVIVINTIPLKLV